MLDISIKLDKIKPFIFCVSNKHYLIGRGVFQLDDSERTKELFYEYYKTAKPLHEKISGDPYGIAVDIIRNIASSFCDVLNYAEDNCKTISREEYFAKFDKFSDTEKKELEKQYDLFQLAGRYKFWKEIGKI